MCKAAARHSVSLGGVRCLIGPDPEQLFGLPRVPMEKQEARTRRASMGLCGVLACPIGQALLFCRATTRIEHRPNPPK